MKQPNAAVCLDADGKLLGFVNDPTGHVQPMLEGVLRDFKAPATRPAGIEAVKHAPFVELVPREAAVREVCERDSNWAPRPPVGGLVVQANSKNLDAPPPGRPSLGIGRACLWVRKDEAEALAKGTFPDSLKVRIARFNVWDNSKGRAGVWKPQDVHEVKIAIEDGRVSGTIVLGEPGQARGAWFRGTVLGFVEAKDGAVTRFDLVILGEGRIANGDDGAAPTHVALAFRLADPTDLAYDVTPSGYLAVHDEYFR